MLNRPGCIFIALSAALAIAAVEAVGSTKLQIQIPQNLKKDSGYDHRNALFGMLPYGGSIQQQVYYMTDKLCSGSDGIKDDKVKPKRTAQGPFILMVDRGDCTFVTKVRNAQHYGAAAVLIADDKCQCDHDNCVPSFAGQLCESVEPMMADDGSGMDIGIPAFLMFKEDADAIKAVLNADGVVRAEMSFAVPNPNDLVQYSFWTRPGDVNSYAFFNEFKDLAVVLDKKAAFTPHFAIYDGQSAGCHTPDGQNQCLTLCTNHGRYCANDPDDDLYSGVSGADVVTESLRRICVWSHYGAPDGIGVNWWNYIQEFIKRCNEPDYFASKECIQDAFSHAGIDNAKIEQCMRDSGGLESDTNNNKLDTEIRLQREQGVVLVPTAFVNDAQVRGAMSAANIFDAVCSGYSEGTRPDICVKCGTCKTPRECVLGGGVCTSSNAATINIDTTGKVSTHTFASSMIMLICLFMGAGYWYYNRTREEMREQVRGILAEYMPLEDDEGSSGGRRGFMMQTRAPHSPQHPDASMMMQPHEMAFAQGNGGYAAPQGPAVDPMRSSLMLS